MRESGAVCYRSDLVIAALATVGGAVWMDAHGRTLLANILTGVAALLAAFAVQIRTRPAGTDPVASSIGPPPAAPGDGPQVLILGPVELVGSRGDEPRPQDRPRLVEMAAAIALQPGIDTRTLAEQLWPIPARDDTVWTSVARLRHWLGWHDASEPILQRVADGRLAITTDHPTDWHQWQALLPDGPHVATTGQLKQALQLVRGIPFEDVPHSRYEWAWPIADHIGQQIADARVELDRRVTTQGDRQ